jgi:hypothetical protein
MPDQPTHELHDTSFRVYEADICSPRSLAPPPPNGRSLHGPQTRTAAADDYALRVVSDGRYVWRPPGNRTSMIRLAAVDETAVQAATDGRAPGAARRAQQ